MADKAGGSVDVRRMTGHDQPVADDWPILANNWGVWSDYRLPDVAPAGVSCPICWDWGLCAECIGVDSDVCPAECDGGSCPACGKRADAATAERAQAILRAYYQW